MTGLKQLLFMVKINGNDCHIPPEFCIIEEVPNIRDPRNMRDILTSCIKTLLKVQDH